MQKRKGAALITVLILFAVCITLSVSILSIYLSTVKQNSVDYEYSQLEYTTLSGLNISTSYITNKNSEFLTKYNNHLSLNSNNRDIPFEITLNDKGIKVVTSITSKQEQVVISSDGPITRVETIYKLDSIGTNENSNIVNRSVDITETNIIGVSSSNTFKTYSIGEIY